MPPVADSIPWDELHGVEKQECPTIFIPPPADEPGIDDAIMINYYLREGAHSPLPTCFDFSGDGCYHPKSRIWILPNTTLIGGCFEGNSSFEVMF